MGDLLRSSLQWARHNGSAYANIAAELASPLKGLFSVDPPTPCTNSCPHISRLKVVADVPMP
jgi:hypothetical protein